MNLNRKIKAVMFVLVLVMAAASAVVILNQSTLEAVFRDVIASLEVDEALLECRRHEKNFLLRRDEIYVDRFQAEFDRLGAEIESLRTVGGATGAVIADLQGSYEQYGERFAEAVGVFRREASESERGEAVERVVAAARECHARIAEIRLASQEQFDSLTVRTRFLNVLAVLVGMVLSVLLASWVTDKILDAVRRESGVEG